MKTKDEFRKNKDTGHPAYIYAQSGKQFIYIGLTHATITHGSKNIELEKNPNPKDSRKAYFRPKAKKSKTNRFKAKEKDWKLTKEDKKKADKIVERSQL